MSQSPSQGIGAERLGWALTGALTIASCVVAWSKRIIVDDAYISLRVAEHAAQGHGLVYNVGERVEGYTNFLWTLVFMARYGLGIEPERFMASVGMLTFLASLGLAAWIGRTSLGSAWGAAAAVLMIGLHLTTNQFATTGMETTLQALLIVGAWWSAWRILEAKALDSARALMGLSCWVALAGLTRMDSAIWLAPLGALMLWKIGTQPTLKAQDKARALGALGLPVGLLMGGWLGWKLSYYGAILPNTYWAKTQVDDIALRGIYYVALYLGGSVTLPLLLALVWAVSARARRDEHTPLLVGMLAAIVLWLAYVIKVGGDFMDLRFMVPLGQFLILPTLWLGKKALVASDKPKLAPIALMAVASVHVLAGFIFYITTQPTWGLHLFAKPFETKPDRMQQWVAAGKAIAAHFPPEDELIIAATTAGALPYYARHYTLDMHGLNEPWVARHGDAFIPVPGHYKIAPPEYLLKQGVHLDFQIPDLWTPKRGELCAFVREQYYQVERFKGKGVKIVQIPVQGDEQVIPLYLKPHPKIDAKIASQGWVSTPLEACLKEGEPVKPAQ